MNRYLHIVNGTTTQQGLQDARVPGDVVEFADVLHEGAVLPDDDVVDWLKSRAEFIASCGWDTSAEALQRAQAAQAAMESFRDYDDVILWYEHDLFDQLLLIRHLHWWWTHAPLDPPSLVSPADYLGPMSGGQLAALFDTRERVTEAQLTLASSAWQAFTAPEPLELVRIVRHENTAPLPHLQGALLRLLEEYPSSKNGLGRTEQQILMILDQSPLTPFDLFQANARREERVFMGDTTFLLRLQRLLGPSHPLLQQNAEDAPLHLTDQGRRVLAGEADDVELNGIDRWIGGVHLLPHRVWRWNGEELAFSARS